MVCMFTGTSKDFCGPPSPDGRGMDSTVKKVGVETRGTVVYECMS